MFIRGLLSVVLIVGTGLGFGAKMNALFVKESPQDSTTATSSDTQ